MKFTAFIILFQLYGAYTSQYLSVSSRKSLMCDNPKDTSMVEQFFNLIFTEYQNQRPVCVCVQMCLEQATYCYPNGCLKRFDKNIKGSSKPVNHIQYRASKSSLFLVEKEQNFDDIFKVTGRNVHAEKGLTIHMNQVVYTPNPFNELVLKYKKLPTMEMRYNLREQVRNSHAAKIKRDKLNISKTRWPMNKNFFLSKKHNSIYKNKINKKTNLVSMTPNVESVIEEPIYESFIAKREEAGEIAATHSHKIDVANSLENLIDNLILDTIATNKIIKTFQESNENNKEKENVEGTPKSTQEANLIKNYTKTDHDNTVDIKMNSVGNNVRNELKLANFTNLRDYGSMITAMSKEIDNQNNFTIEMVKAHIDKVNFNKLQKKSTNIVSEYNDDGKIKTLATDIIPTDSMKGKNNNSLPRSTFATNVVKSLLRKPKMKRIVRKLL